jgi:AraC-like DNA-binding protein
MRDFSTIFTVRTDLASETREFWREKNSGEPGGTRYENKKICGVDADFLEVMNSDGEKATGKPKGRYCTLNVGKIWDSDIRGFDNAMTALCRIIRNFIPENAKSMKEYYDELVLFDEGKITSIINIALMLAKYILLEKMLYSVTNDCVDRVVHYISENLSEPFSIKKLSAAVGYSSSEIYKSFHKYHHCTVGEYVTKSRIEYSRGLLLETDLSVEEISVKCGFSSAPYFSKKFKELMGISPVKYRKQGRT